MILAKYYALVYTIIVILFAIPSVVRYSNGGLACGLERPTEPISNSIIFTLIIILFVGFRPNSGVFADGVGYWAAFIDHRWEGMSLKDANYQFATKWLMSSLSSMGVNPRVGFIVLATVVYGGAYIAMRKMFPSDTLLAMILYCGTFGVFAGAVNGIKSGMACSMFLCALAYRDRRKICVLFLLLSLGFHHSLELSVGAFILCLFYKNTDKYYAFWVASFLVALLHITYFQTFLADFTDDHGAQYLLADSSDPDVWGFRFDFVLYSAAPLALGLWVKSMIDIEESKYQFFINVYLVMNALWLLCMYAAYTNRFAALSWSLFPVLILEPLVNMDISDNQHKVLVWFVIGQLTFTLLMEILSL